MGLSFHSVRLMEVDVSADHLTSRGKSFEAAQIHLDYAQDVDSAVSALSHGAEFAEASRIVSHRRLVTLSFFDIGVQRIMG